MLALRSAKFQSLIGIKWNLNPFNRSDTPLHERFQSLIGIKWNLNYYSIKQAIEVAAKHVSIPDRD